MCFTAIVFSVDGKPLGVVGESVFLSMLGEMSSNHDGFAVRIDNELVRTMKEEEVYKLIPLVRKSKHIHLHFRYATSGSKSLENVHLWRRGRYYCSHNGTASGYSGYSSGHYSGESDSNRLFKEAERHLEAENWEEVAKVLERANGIMLLSRDDWERIVVAMPSKEAKVSLWGERVVSISSDTVDQSDGLLIKRGYRRVLWFEFPRYEVIPIKKVREVNTTLSDGKLIVMDGTGRKLEEVKCKYKWTGYYYYGYKDDNNNEFERCCVCNRVLFSQKERQQGLCWECMG